MFLFSGASRLNGSGGSGGLEASERISRGPFVEAKLISEMAEGKSIVLLFLEDIVFTSSIDANIPIIVMLHARSRCINKILPMQHIARYIQ